MSELDKGKTDVIIIGAGISGIKCALELTKSGISNIILEARDRTGGRLHTETFESSSTPVDIGASWFHDCYDNPLLKKYWTSGKIDFTFDDGRSSIFNAEGLVDDNEHLKPIFEETIVHLGKLSMELKPSNDISVKEAVYNYFKEKKYCMTDYQIKYAPLMARYFEMWLGLPWDILSARTIAVREHRGRDALVLNGYKTVYNLELNELLEAANTTDADQLIELNHVVYKIQWDDESKEIKVYSQVGDKIELYSSEYLVVTVPLAVLKLNDPNEKGCIEWSPNLPKTLADLLSTISTSHLGKIFFEFPETFWDMNDDRIMSLANVDEKFFEATKNDTNDELAFKSPSEKSDAPIPKDTVPNGLDYTIAFLNVARSTQKPIMLALTAAPLTQYIEEATPDVVFEVFKPVFARISGKDISDIPKPVEIKKTNWTNDPYARCSYTGVTIGDDPVAAVDALLNPKDIFDGSGRVRFAGEGATDYGAGCVHGAWVSGLKQANIIKEMMDKH